MKLITEINEEIECMVEESASGGQKSYYISGPYVNTEVQNRNGRFYPKSVIESQMDKQLLLIKENRAMGELNHPNSPTVNPERACHIIKSLKWEGNDVIGKSKVLTALPMGKIVAGLMDEGVKFGVSTRGMGSVKRNSKGMNEVQSDFRLVCVDVVSDPSGPSCFVNGIMEGAEWVYDPASDSFIEKKIQEVKDTVENLVRKRELTVENKFTLFDSYLKFLTSK